jgi:1-acyl-sn-glycerol-3-phosphate acyltransferase
MIQNGPVILAMNHQSYLDPPLAGTTCDRPIYFLTRENVNGHTAARLALTQAECHPVNQEGIDRSALKALIRVLKAGNAALVFPKGRARSMAICSRHYRDWACDRKTLAPVVPRRVFGAHQALPRGRRRLRFVPITIVIGEPIFFTAADNRIASQGHLPAAEPARYGCDRGITF